MLTYFNKSIGPSLANAEWTCQSCLRRSVDRSVRRAYVNAAASQEGRSRGLQRPSFRTISRDTPKSFSVRSLTTKVQDQPRKLTRKALLPDKPARTRFAPSPTGYLHIGGLRTALFSYLLAKRTGGQFLLRIEDTDQKRLVPDAEKRLLDDLHWAGLAWDEGPEVGGPHGPYRQSERTQIYHQHAVALLEKGAAYRCFCTAQSAGHGKAAYVSSGCYQGCASIPTDEARNRSAQESHTVRLKPSTDSVKRSYPDLVYGKIVPLKRSHTSVAPSEDSEAGIDAADTILFKSDGTPTYHFANVVDDHLMEITHVIRGSEWMASTPLHYDLYRAFDWTPPIFAHVGLLVDENKAKLSKRKTEDFGYDVQSMRHENGVLPETLVNFLALQGWSNPTTNDVMSMDQLVEVFDLKFTKGNTMVGESKLWFLQKQHVARACDAARTARNFAPISTLVESVVQEVEHTYPRALSRFSDDRISLFNYCANIVLADSAAYRDPKQFAHRIRYFFTTDLEELDLESDTKAGRFDHLSARLLDLTQKALEEVHQPARHAIAGSPDLQPYETHLQVAVLVNKAIDDAVASVSEEDLAGMNLPYKHAADSNLAKAGDAMPHMETPATAAARMARQRLTLLNALRSYLRQKLCISLPGPPMGAVIAILGYEGCCQRLGLEVTREASW